MTETIVFPDVEAVVVAALSARVGVPVATRVPNPRPDAFVLVGRVGGSRPNVVTDRAAVTVECWSASNVEACDLSRWARAYVHTLAPDTVRRVVELSGPASSPDPVSETPRYVFTVQIDTRGAAVA